jgi:signal transduction histidine kinase/ActR/RegA family two-component response regulator
LTSPPRPEPSPATPAFADTASSDQRARIAGQIEDERVAIVYELAPIPVAAGLAFGVLVSVILWPHRPAWVVGSWLFLKLLVGIPRVLDGRRFQRGVRVAYWRRRALVFLVLDGLIWGSMGLLFMPAEAPGIQAVMLASLIGIAGVGVFTYVSDARGSVLVLLSVLLPSMVYQALRNTPDGWLASLGLAIYLGMMCLEAKRSETRVIEMLRLRFENAFIADERQRAMLLSEHASAAKSRFLATVSHEMRTPLNGIMGMTQLLQRSPLNDEQRRQLDILHRSSLHLQTVIGDLLDLSRIEFGKLSLDERPIRLEETVREVVGLLQPIAEEKGLRFTMSLAGGLPASIVGDASRIKQVLHNLLGNAIKFTSHGEVALQVAHAGDGRLSFRVRDSGEGVRPEMSQRIFDAFEQGPAATVQGRVGTGLGLTISRRLARAMGGDVVCEPGSGRGASFVFTMPCRSAQASAEAGAARAAAPATWPTLGGRVLVVDDNPVNALVASAMLEHAGLSVEVAEDGAAALDRMGRGELDLVLMDCQLPELDGWEATRRWRSGERDGAHLPIVALTANAVVGDRDRCLHAGMDDYLAKPVQMDELIAVVMRQLERQRLPQAG